MQINRKETGINIIRLIDERKMSVREVSAKADIDGQLIYHWSWGIAVPSATNLVKLSRTLNVPIEKLLVVEE